MSHGYCIWAQVQITSFILDRMPVAAAACANTVSVDELNPQFFYDSRCSEHFTYTQKIRFFRCIKPAAKHVGSTVNFDFDLWGFKSNDVINVQSRTSCGLS